MTTPDIYVRIEEEDGERHLAIGIEETDDDLGMAMKIGPLVDTFTLDDISPEGLAEAKAAVLEQWRELQRDPEAAMQDMLQGAEKVHIEFDDDDDAPDQP